MPAPRVIGVNSPAAHLVQQNDIVILISYAQMTTEEGKDHEPRVVHVDENNRILQLGKDLPRGSPPVSCVPPFAVSWRSDHVKCRATVIAVIILLAGVTMHLCTCVSDRNSRPHILEREK